ncbi:hypothetical protein GIB67_037807 [Kingdonia uniflora]|uniref:Late embryogenesis abundant protein LEA-2 subgroup domain-containing protein n=1 Tax=Kingdonia uniflora TaxID=39325 RepID=A0A7J7LVA0_9MAGN|nr:hypothetical protein GIB67_037807 [Kingdonia uniflora]
MAGQVHPHDSPPTVENNTTEPPQSNLYPEKTMPEKPVPPPGTYVVQIPKDQIYRYPPPENAYRYRKYTSLSKKSNSCCCCLSWLLGLIIGLIVLIAISAGVVYLVVRPKVPKYSVERISIKGFNLTNPNPATAILVSPEFDVTIRAHNPNKKISIYYKKGSAVTVSHSRTTTLCKGVLPVFYQPTKNVTVFQTVLKASGLQLTSAVAKTLTEQQKIGQIPLGLDLKVPVKIKIGSLKIWTFTVKIRCDITVDKLTLDSNLVSKKCKVDIKM